MKKYQKFIEKKKDKTLTVLKRTNYKETKGNNEGKINFDSNDIKDDSKNVSKMSIMSKKSNRKTNSLHKNKK